MVHVLRVNKHTRTSGPLAELLHITFGPRPVVAEEFREIGGSPQVAIYGSWARRFRGEVGREPADIDVVVIGSVDRDQVYAAAERAQERLQMPVNTTTRSPRSWAEATDPLVMTAKQDAVFVLGEGIEG